MEYKESTWYGFRRFDFSFEGYGATVVLPKERHKAGRIALKTEYFDVFPDTEVEMLKAGYHLAYLENRSRWGTEDDCDRKARLLDLLSEKLGTSRRAVAVGMSCGGLHALMFAARYPEHLSFMYLDAPLLTFFSIRPHWHKWQNLEIRWPEIREAWGFRSYAEAFCYNGQPLHRLPEILKHKIPLALVWGTSDELVPPEENAEILRDLWLAADVPIRVFERIGYGHHPHGLEDPAPLLAFIEETAL